MLITAGVRWIHALDDFRTTIGGLVVALVIVALVAKEALENGDSAPTPGFSRILDMIWVPLLLAAAVVLWYRFVLAV